MTQSPNQADGQTSAKPQATAQVVLYTTLSFGGALSPVSSNSPFSGYIFAGEELLTHINVHNFVALQLQPGQYIFSASTHKHPAGNSRFVLDVDVGKQYYLHASLYHDGYSVLPNHGIITQATCEEAHNAAERLSPVKDVEVAPMYRATAQFALPECPAPEANHKINMQSP